MAKNLISQFSTPQKGDRLLVSFDTKETKRRLKRKVKRAKLKPQ